MVAVKCKECGKTARHIPTKGRGETLVLANKYVRCQHCETPLKIKTKLDKSFGKDMVAADGTKLERGFGHVNGEWY